MDTALLHAGATAATGGAGVAFSPVPHISIYDEFIFLISECWCPHDIADSVTRPRSQHTRAHAPSFLHIPASVSSSCHQVLAAHLLTSGLSSQAGAILSHWHSLGGPTVHAFNFLILLLWRLTSKPKPLLPASVDEETLRLCGGWTLPLVHLNTAPALVSAVVMLTVLSQSSKNLMNVENHQVSIFNSFNISFQNSTNFV